MSTVEEASRRLEVAVTRLEVALLDESGRPRAAPVDHGHGREIELLGAECDSLRRALEASELHNQRLAAAATDVATRLDQTIGELSDLVEG